MRTGWTAPQRCRRSPAGATLALLILAVAGPLPGCGEEDEGAPSEQERACSDTAAAVAAAAQRCGQDYNLNYDAFVDAAAGGDCANIRIVRDEASLRGTCIPSFQTLSCDDLTAGVIDPSCADQLLRKHDATHAPGTTVTDAFAAKMGRLSPGE